MAVRYTYSNPQLQKEFEEDPRAKMAKALQQSSLTKYQTGEDPLAYGISRVGDIAGGLIAEGRAAKEFEGKEAGVREALAKAMATGDRAERAKILAENPYLAEKGEALQEAEELHGRGREEKLSDEALEFERQKKLASLQSVLGTQAQLAGFTGMQTLQDIKEQQKAAQEAKIAQTGLGTYDPTTGQITGGAYELAGKEAPGWFGRNILGKEDPRALVAAQLKASTGAEYKPSEISQQLVANALSAQRAKQAGAEQQLGILPEKLQATQSRQFARAALPAQIGKYKTVGVQ